jgi:hypothetical protein
MKHINYLDMLGDDLVEKILNIVGDYYENDIIKVSKKLSNVKKLVKGLNISKIDDEDYKGYCISCGYISYEMDGYLYKKFPYDNVVLINKWKDYIFDTDGSVPDLILRSKVLKSPTYLDILREINKLYEKQSKILGGYDDHRFLEGIQIMKHNYQKYNLNKEKYKKYNCIEYALGS